MKSISIALCTYNGARYLDEQLRTLRLQADAAEIVVVDDGSTDGTWAILERHAGQDARIKLHRNAAQLGVTGNFERAISLVRGTWVALADQDDVWLPGKLARLRAAWNGRAGLLHHASRKFHGQVPAVLPSPAGERRKFRGRDLRRLLYRNTIVGHSALFRTDLVRRLTPFPAGVPHDWWIGVGLAAQGEVQYLDEYLVHYRIHGHNAYHATGSRYRRLLREQEMRLHLLAALAEWRPLPESARAFAQDYRRHLLQSAARSSPWALWRFYLRHADVLFGGVAAPPSWFTCFRKSLGATLGTVVAGPRPAPVNRVLRPALAAPAEQAIALEKAG
jgi:glycosyltransferase involved in cell wall biosynthesis